MASLHIRIQNSEPETGKLKALTLRTKKVFSRKPRFRMMILMHQWSYNYMTCLVLCIMSQKCWYCISKMRRTLHMLVLLIILKKFQSLVFCYQFPHQFCSDFRIFFSLFHGFPPLLNLEIILYGYQKFRSKKKSTKKLSHL